MRNSNVKYIAPKSARKIAFGALWWSTRNKMKVILERSDLKKTITVRLSAPVFKEIEKLSDEHGISRQRLIEGILEQALQDKTFVLRIQD